jgi:hypothetical protein
MTPGTKFSQSLKTNDVLVALTALFMSVSVCAATPNEQALYDYQYSMLRNYKLICTEEIFDYCVDKFGPFGAIARRVGRYLERQGLLERDAENSHK